MIVLDTDVVSEPMKPEPAATVCDWLDEQAAETPFLSSVTVAELLFCIGALPVATAHGFAVATRDASAFKAAGVPIINPWTNGR